MRGNRYKPTAADPRHGTYYHLISRVAGDPKDLPFGEPEKEQFIKTMKRLAAYYTLDLLAWQVMGNHFHIVAFAPERPPSPEEAARRYRAYHNDKKVLDPDTPECHALTEKLRDISCFMHDLLQQFAAWYNKTHGGRRGSLWAGRFKNPILEPRQTLLSLITYVELNAVRAKLVADPADYRFGSWGEWSATGTHPFAAALLRHLRYNFGEHTAAWTLADFHRELRTEFARIIEGEKTEATPDSIQQAMTEAAKPAPLTVFNRRVRYWSDGLAIGSRLFLRNLMAEWLPAEKVENHRTSPQFRPADSATATPICAWRRLRVPG